jgi:hypothetical protein
MRTVLVLIPAAVVLALGLVGSAAADSAYHTERLALRGVGGAPGGGMVVNVHANGPNVYAHEIYTLSHAVPGTYQSRSEHLSGESGLQRDADHAANGRDHD